MKKILFFLLIVALLSSCEYFTLLSKKEWTEKSGNEDNVIIYISGSYDLDAFTSVPCYWKIKDDNIERVNSEGYLINTLNYAYSIYVVGDTVYTCGSCNNGTNNQACYWINTKKYVLEVDNPSNDSQANSITVKNGVIFIAGQEDIYGCFWINNNKNDLINFFASTSIFIDQISSSKHVLYVGGQDVNYYAYLFKDGEMITLPDDGADLSGVTSVYVSNYTIYSAGIVQFTGNNYACLWENNNLKYLSGGQFANSVFISDENVYVAGQSGTGLACYWKNNDIKLLSTLASDARSIFVYDNDIYIAGQDQSWACLWINDKLIRLDNASSMAYSIFVKSDSEK